MKHAYLLLVHKNPEQVKTLLQCLDHENNDIYIHIDIKNKDIDTNILKASVKKSTVYFTNRISVKWADYSIVEATYILLKAALKNGPYLYYHLISGQDMPLKPISEINSFYENNDINKNYIYFETGDKLEHDLKLRIHIKKYLFHGGRFFRKLYELMFLKRDLSKIPYGKGDAWFDITEDLAKLIIKYESWSKKTFYDFHFPDESFIQTIINVNKLNHLCSDKGTMRMIDWNICSQIR